MNESKQTQTEQKRKVGVGLGIGIFLIPMIFAWFTLRKGHSGLARGLAFGWLIFTLLYFIISPGGNGESQPSTPTPTSTSEPADIVPTLRAHS